MVVTTGEITEGQSCFNVVLFWHCFGWIQDVRRTATGAVCSACFSDKIRSRRTKSYNWPKVIKIAGDVP